jgi:hypothetical protein
MRRTSQELVQGDRQISNSLILSGKTLKGMDNVGIVVDDPAAAVGFFKELGLELEGEAGGAW